MSGEQRDGFGVVTRDVMLDPTISSNGKTVYGVLAVHRDSTSGQCFPSRETIRAATGWSLATVKRALVELEEKAVIQRVPRFREGRQTSNQYVLVDAVARRRKRKGGVHQ